MNVRGTCKKVVNFIRNERREMARKSQARVVFHMISEECTCKGVRTPEAHIIGKLRLEISATKIYHSKNEILKVKTYFCCNYEQLILSPTCYVIKLDFSHMSKYIHL